MIPSLRQRFNVDWRPQQYESFLRIIEQRTGDPPRFRHSETPCFFPSQLIAKMAAYGKEMVEALLADEAYARASAAVIPAQYRVPAEPPRPLFVQADFGLDRQLEPRLVEIQGFPSLYSYEPILAEAYREAFRLDDSVSAFLPGITPAEYWKMLREAVVGGHDPEQVVLLEIDPENQKTRCDFLITERQLGVHAVDIRALRRNGNRLLYERNGRLIPIRRIYNRTVMADLERRGAAIPFDWNEDLNVEWAGHPNWFFRLSKFSLPYLDHPAVPKSVFLSETSRLDGMVLKPLFSFGGSGVVMFPAQKDIAAIPPEERHLWILQERVDFLPVIDTPYGATKVEIRIMYVWLDRLCAVNTIVRMSRGAEIGVDHNQGEPWAGASAAFLGEPA
jgi:hypothetical protein